MPQPGFQAYGAAAAPQGYPGTPGGPANQLYGRAGGYQPYPPVQSAPSRSRGRIRGPNSFSWTAIGFSAAYLVIAATTSFVLLGIVPVMSTIRAFQRGEKMAPFAAIAAVVTVGSAVYILTGHH